MPDMLEIQCSGCSSKLAVPEIHVGKKVRCRKCQSVTVVSVEIEQELGFTNRCVGCGQTFQSAGMEDLCQQCTEKSKLPEEAEPSFSEAAGSVVSVDKAHDISNKRSLSNPDPPKDKSTYYSPPPPGESTLWLVVLCVMFSVMCFAVYMIMRENSSVPEIAELPETQVESVASAPPPPDLENIRVPWQILLDRLKNDQVREAWLRQVERLGDEFLFSRGSGQSAVDNELKKSETYAMLKIVNHSLDPIAETAAVELEFSLYEGGVDKRIERTIKRLDEMYEVLRAQGSNPKLDTLNADINKRTTRTYRVTAYWDKGWKIEKTELSVDKKPFKLVDDQHNAAIWLRDLFSIQ